MVFNILSVVAFVLSSLCTMFLGVCGYGLWRSKRDLKKKQADFLKSFGNFNK